MTTKTYQAQLPLRNHRIVTPVPMPRPVQPAGIPSPHEWALDFKRGIEKIFAEGFWFCKDCDCITEREEGENGQPAHCSLCGGHKLEWNPPLTALQKEGA